MNIFSPPVLSMQRIAPAWWMTRCNLLLSLSSPQRGVFNIFKGSLCCVWIGICNHTLWKYNGERKYNSSSRFKKSFMFYCVSIPLPEEQEIKLHLTSFFCMIITFFWLLKKKKICVWCFVLCWTEPLQCLQLFLCSCFPSDLMFSTALIAPRSESL